MVDNLKELERVQDRLDDYYNGDKLRFKRHGWDEKRAREEEFRTISNRLLGLVRGPIGAKRDPSNLVVIGIGLGQFSFENRLSSLHGSFVSYFVSLVRSIPTSTLMTVLCASRQFINLSHLFCSL